MGVEKPIIINNTYRLKGYTSHIFTEKEKWFTKLISEIARGGTPYIFTPAKRQDSRFGTYALEKCLKELFPDRDILRVDADSVAEPRHPALGIASNINEYLRANPGLIVIASPTLETGIDIHIKGHFTAVFAYGNGVITENSLRQAIARVREPVPRCIYLNKDSKIRNGNGTSCPEEYIKRHTSTLNKLIKTSRKFDVEFLSEEDQEIFAQDPSRVFTPMLAMETLAKIATRENAIAPDYREHVIEQLKREGHTVLPGELTPEEIELVGMDPKQLSATLTKSKDDLYKEHKAEVVQAEDFATEEDFHLAKDRTMKSKEDRNQVKKHKLKDRYGEVDEHIVELDDKKYYPKLVLLYYATLGHEKAQERDEAIAIPYMEKGAFLPPDITDKLILEKANVARVLLNYAAKLGMDPTDGEKKYSNDSPEFIAFNALLTEPKTREYLRDEAKLGDFSPESTPYNNVRKFYQLFGIRFKATKQRQSQRKEKRHMLYQFDPKAGVMPIKDKFFQHRLKKEQEWEQAKKEKQAEEGPLEKIKVLALGRFIEDPIVWPEGSRTPQLKMPRPRKQSETQVHPESSVIAQSSISEPQPRQLEIVTV
ncbi:MAG: hypothetical protein F6K55_29125 [Moorea sp. SIO4A3]|nr:hypothetical protein [Moorena sp. SIO4A3]